MRKQDVRSMTMDEMELLMGELGEPRFRAKQLFDWVQKKKAKSFDEMTNLSKALREKLKETCKISRVEIARTLVSEKDGTTKYLFTLENDKQIEAVLMRYGYGNAVCISTQVGCRMGCRFCASTLDGVEGNLTAGEMLSQVFAIGDAIGKRIGSIVLMGSGEPLDNYDQVLRFLHLIHDERGQGLSQRHITLSTCGLIDRIRDLKQEHLQITLAVSLHAPNDEIRNELMPISRKNPMDQLLRACKEYGDETKRRVTFEYALIRGVNDQREHAQELASRLHNMLCHVNLIPINTVKERQFYPPSEEVISAFAQTLQERGIETTVRRKLGSDINAACGQLRKSERNRR